MLSAILNFNFLNLTTSSEALSNTASVQASPLQSAIPIVVILIIFYFFIIRPQSKKYKDQQSMIEMTKIGDEIVTLSGIFGKISSFDGENICHLEVSPNVNLKINKAIIVKNISLDERSKQEILEKNKK